MHGAAFSSRAEVLKGTGILTEAQVRIDLSGRLGGAAGVCDDSTPDG